jgi:hypothetical protein
MAVSCHHSLFLVSLVQTPSSLLVLWMWSGWLLEPTKETRVDLNALLPTLANQLAWVQGAATNNKPLEHVTESDNIPPQLPNDHAKSLNLHRPDNELGNLDTRFSEDTGRFVTDEEVCHLNSQLVIEDQKMQLSMFCIVASQSCTWRIDWETLITHSRTPLTSRMSKPIPLGWHTTHKAGMTSPTISLWSDLMASHIRCIE